MLLAQQHVLYVFIHSLGYFIYTWDISPMCSHECCCMAVLLQGTPFSNILFNMHLLSLHFLDEKRRCDFTCEILLQQILKTKEHNFVQLGTFLPSAFKVGVDFADVWRILFVVCDLKETDRCQAQPASRKKPHNRLTE